jgi:hypothetical protein
MNLKIANQSSQLQESGFVINVSRSHIDNLRLVI